MADETIIEPVPEPSDAQKRIIQLSDKVRTTSEELSTEKKAREAAEKKAAFSEGYAEVLTSNPAAKEFKADIEAKVMSGYTVEDATYAVLGKAGKLGQPQAAEVQSPAGGSAPNVIPTGQKGIGEMTQAERRAQLEKEIAWN